MSRTRAASTAVRAGEASFSTNPVGHAIHVAAGQRWTRNLLRLGCVARGLIYLVPGYLALRLAIGTHGSAMNQTGAIAWIGDGPQGRALLMGLAVGFAGYSLWGALRAWLDPFGEGHAPSGLATRLGYAASSLAYLSLLFVTIGFIGSAGSDTAVKPHWTAKLLALPWGAWLVALVGVCWIVGGAIGQVRLGWSGKFAEVLDLTGRSAVERAWALRMGRIGIIARGIVFGMIGVFLISAAFHDDAREARGMDGVLLVLAQQPSGRLLLATAALGLMTFGAFAILGVRWMRVRVPGSGSRRRTRGRGSS